MSWVGHWADKKVDLMVASRAAKMAEQMVDLMAGS